MRKGKEGRRGGEGSDKGEDDDEEEERGEDGSVKNQRVLAEIETVIWKSR